jgi:hypothetical protein
MEIVMVKAPGGALVPMDDCEHRKTTRWKVGGVVRGEFTEMRNGAYFRKWWALAKLAFDMWADDLPEQEYRGQPVRPDFERFRKDLIILTGRFDPVYAADGTVRLVAHSISWARMSQDGFDRMYSETINVILAKILNDKGMTEASLRATVESIMRFDS